MESQSHPLCHSEAEGSPLLGDTEAWNKEKTLECSCFGLGMSVEHPSKTTRLFWLPAASAVTESLPGGVTGTLPSSALLFPFLCLPWGAPGRSRRVEEVDGGAAGGGWCPTGVGDTGSPGVGTSALGVLALLGPLLCCPMEDWGKLTTREA